MEGKNIDFSGKRWSLRGKHNCSYTDDHNHKQNCGSWETSITASCSQQLPLANKMSSRKRHYPFSSRLIFTIVPLKDTALKEHSTHWTCLIFMKGKELLSGFSVLPHITGKVEVPLYSYKVSNLETLSSLCLWPG